MNIQEIYNIITPYSSLQTIKDGEESNYKDAKEEEKYNIYNFSFCHLFQKQMEKSKQTHQQKFWGIQQNTRYLQLFQP